MNKLIYDAPIVEISSDPKTLRVYHDPMKVLLNVEEGVETKFTSNSFPYLVLAHMAASSFCDESEDPHHIRFEVLERIASCNSIMRRADYGLFHEGIPTFDLPGIGELIKTDIGIVEPIVQALWYNFLNYPVKFEQFFEEMVTKKQYLVVNRSYIAVKNAELLADKETLLIAEKIVKTFKDLVPEMLAIVQTENSSNRTELPDEMLSRTKMQYMNFKK